MLRFLDMKHFPTMFLSQRLSALVKQVTMIMITNFLGGPPEQLKFLVPVELWVVFLQVAMETTQVSIH